MIFLTGSTGFLGREILCRLLVAYPKEEFCLLVRQKQNIKPQARIQSLVTDIFGESRALKILSRISVLQGDLNLDGFGLGDERLNWLARNTTKVFHSGADVSFTQTLAESRAVNVGGTSRILDFVKLAQRLGNTGVSLHYVSTAYVAGDVETVVSADQLNPAGIFKNNYEKTKAEAEALVRAESHSLRSVIYRPSIIVGDSITGQTTSFNVIYVPAKYVVKGLLTAMPAHPKTPCDIVPVDYVADSVIKLSEIPLASGSCFHLCSGVGREPTLMEIVEKLVATFNKYVAKELRLPNMIQSEIAALAQLSFQAAMASMKHLEKFFGNRFETIMSRVLPYLLYMNRNPRFDNTSTIAALSGIMPPAPHFLDYAENIFEYCLHTNWGRNPWTNPSRHATWVQRLRPEALGV